MEIIPQKNYTPIETEIKPEVKTPPPPVTPPPAPPAPKNNDKPSPLLLIMVIILLIISSGLGYLILSGNTEALDQLLPVN